MFSHLLNVRQVKLRLEQWFSTWGSFDIFLGVARASDKIFIVIFCSASTTAFRMPDRKFSEGGCWVRLGCKIGCCMKKVENHWVRRTVLSVKSHEQ